MTVLLVPFWRQLKLKLTHNILTIFFLQNCKKSKYRFLTFLPLTWVKIMIQKPAVHQMNGWNLYFLAYFMQSIRKLNLRGPRTSDISLKFIESPFITVENSDSWKVRFCTKVQSSQISKILGVFQDQKMDIISCHDCQFVSCQNQIIRLTWFDFKYKKVHVNGIWDNENECN